MKSFKFILLSIALICVSSCKVNYLEDSNSQSNSYTQDYPSIELRPLTYFRENAVKVRKERTFITHEDGTTAVAGEYLLLNEDKNEPIDIITSECIYCDEKNNELDSYSFEEGEEFLMYYEMWYMTEPMQCLALFIFVSPQGKNSSNSNA